MSNANVKCRSLTKRKNVEETHTHHTHHIGNNHSKINNEK